MKIGIPRALLYHYYYPFWKTYLDSLGIETIVSSPTNKWIMDNGAKHSVPEICVPIKVYLGHVLELMEKKVDYIFVPRFVSIQKGQFFCPKFMGLPDIIRHSFPEMESMLLSPYVESTTEDLATSIKQYYVFEEKCDIKRSDNRKALKKAETVWNKFRELSLKGYDVSEATEMVMNDNCRALENKRSKNTNEKSDDTEITIGVLGYVYNIYDSVISLDILNRLKEMGVRVKTFEMLSEDKLKAQLVNMPKTLFWTFSDKLFAAGNHFYQDSDIDGIIHVTAFGCGPDSMLGKLLELDSTRYEKPFMTVRIDEHSGENHLQTRVEAFVDMLKRKKRNSKKGALA
ncbi:Predicted nucleotide-binding protein, sugar kinase/HSP70/actin superfamily [Tindallia magadiensis]|uniref:Predicted nucleotide-binding protein, sugar kinase/HSP70/actin superfamily n=1 Tax=Tindallia magadiensis TaxID=69895 RepID=A0A1I3FSQ9_9FIRM|nr:acyl-CoA dehydratase activase-related protein [Tindallia magadiensis]SFI14239.1 Predicted nucleotide-binding protein, sugar kinase/HSP70/actin superfamily [Tindallia magadiensis]